MSKTDWKKGDPVNSANLNQTGTPLQTTNTTLKDGEKTELSSGEVIVDKNGGLYVSTSGALKLITILKGDKGDTGATGKQGPAGKDGAKGETGAQGPKGDKGDKGETGAKGATGTAGKDGKVQSVSSVAPDENGDIDLAKVLDQQGVKTKLSSIIQAEIAKPAE